MNAIQRKSALVPPLFCNILSPYSTRHQVEDCLTTLLADDELIELCIALANQRHMVATFFSVIQSHALGHLLETRLRDYMNEMSAFMQQRSLAQAALAQKVIHTSNQHGITPLLIKGSGTLFSRLYPAQGVRFMSDLDILYQAKDVLTIFRLLQKQGFSIPQKYLPEEDIPAYVKHPIQANIPDGPQHLLPLYREGAPCTIELHMRPLHRRYEQYLDTDTAFATAIPIEFTPDMPLSARRMSPENEVIYCFAHSQIAHGYHRRDYLDIRQMDFFVRLIHQYEAELDWDNIHLRVRQAGGETLLQHHLFAVNRLFGTNFPLPDTGLDKQRLERRYLSSLRSCFPQQHLQWQFRQLVIELASILSREKMQMLYKVDSPIGLWQARLHYLAIKLWKFRHPVKFWQRIQYASRMF